MTTIYRRQISTAPPSIFARDEETRIADRKRLFHQLSERKQREQSLHSLELALRELDVQADDAADAHAAAAGPLQLELSSPTITAARRTKLLNELAKLNEVLERKIASVKQIRKPLAVQKQELSALVSSAVAIESKIMQSATLADRCSHWAASRGLKFSHERLSVATKAARIAADELRQAENDPRKYDVVQFLRRAGEWAAEVASSQRMLDAAKAESENTHKKLMAEE